MEHNDTGWITVPEETILDACGETPLVEAARERDDLRVAEESSEVAFEEGDLAAPSLAE